MERTKRIYADIGTLLLLSVFVFGIAYVFLGYAKYGLDAHYYYLGGDDITNLANIKNIGENGWFWFNDKVGAPFGISNMEFVANLLSNVDNLITKLLYYIFNDANHVLNMRFLLVFPLCAINSYIVLRILKNNIIFSALGSFIFAFSPYILYRNIGHLTLTACFFVPFSILLIIWALDENDYLKFDKYFFKNKKNIFTIILTILISNNGIGYYAFFTCFFLCVIALYRLFREKSIKSIIVPVKIIFLIIFFSFLAILPAIIYSGFGTSDNSAIVRNVADGELYSLKIAQLFVPINGHGIPLIENFIEIYNANMPLVNENVGSYLGVFGIAGFLVSVVYLIKPNYENKEQTLYVLTKLNIVAVIFATIGGFCSLFSFAFRMIRGYNRISIFIEFMCICIICIYFKKIVGSSFFKQSKWKKGISIFLICAFSAISIYDVLPSYGSHDSEFEYYGQLYESDEKFVQAIETQLDEGAMVFQLPYHETPEGGSVNNMADYQLYAGYVHSKTLKWSYGSIKGSKADSWLKYISCLPTPQLINTICQAGFTGIYIDARAYTAEDLSSLMEQIQQILNVQPLVSQNGNLYFYNLTEYINQNNISVEPVVLEEYKSYYLFSAGNLFGTTGNTEQTFQNISLHNGGIQYGPYASFESGTYEVTILGTGLQSVTYDVWTSETSTNFSIEELSKTDAEIKYIVSFNSDVSGIEFRTFNDNTDTVTINSIFVRNKE